MKREVGIFLIAVLSLSVAVAVESASLDVIDNFVVDARLRVSQSVQVNLLKIHEVLHVILLKIDKLDESLCKTNLLKLFDAAKMMQEHENTHCGLRFDRKVTTLLNKSIEKTERIKDELRGHESEVFDCLKTALVNSKDIFQLVKSQIEVCEKWSSN